MSGVEVLKRTNDGVLTLLVYRPDGRAPSPQACEDAGEDHGFYDTRIEPARGYVVYPNARLLTEGYTGALCEHRWDSVMHFSRNPYGYIRTCGKCGVKTMESHRKRSNKGTYTYDVWELREHIWRKWMQTGPVPGALQPQAHHKGGEAE